MQYLCLTLVETIYLLLSQAISSNGVHPPGSGTTPLHSAASIGRTDVVDLLLEQDGIDATFKDANGKHCKKVARGKDDICAIEGVLPPLLTL
jgi:ankyrin repeat protein